MIGVDPGASTTGIGVLWTDPLVRGDIPMLLQVDSLHAPTFLYSMVESYQPSLIAVEKFEITRRTVRMANAKDREVTQELIAYLLNAWPGQVISLAPGASKAFATDERLKRIHPDVMRDATGMRHARDGLRVALWTAVERGLIPDPMSKA